MRGPSRIARAVVILLLFSAGAAQAAELVGKPAPPINAEEWLNTKEPLSLEKLKGKIVFLMFTATW